MARQGRDSETCRSEASLRTPQHGERHDDGKQGRRDASQNQSPAKKWQPQQGNPAGPVCAKRARRAQHIRLGIDQSAEERERQRGADEKSLNDGQERGDGFTRE